MSPDELAKQCATSINACASMTLSPADATILITTPKGWKAPPMFPRGRIARWHEDGSRTRYLPAVKTLAWLVANEMARIKGVA